MTPGAGLGILVGMIRLGEVFDHETRAAQAAHQLLPAVQELQRARLAVQTAGDRRQRALR